MVAKTKKRQTPLLGFFSGKPIRFNNAEACRAMSTLSALFFNYAGDHSRLLESTVDLFGSLEATYVRRDAKWAKRNADLIEQSLAAFQRGDNPRGYRLAARVYSGGFGGSLGLIWLAAYWAIGPQDADLADSDLTEVRRLRQSLRLKRRRVA